MSEKAKVLRQSDFELSETARRFEGEEYGVPISFFMTEHPPGKLVPLHRHPYPETFVIRSGRGRFTAGEEKLEARGGEIVIVPPNTWHGFESIGDEPLVQVSIHPAPRVEQEWLGEDEPPR